MRLSSARTRPVSQLFTWTASAKSIPHWNPKELRYICSDSSSWYIMFVHSAVWSSRSTQHVMPECCPKNLITRWSKSTCHPLCCSEDSSGLSCQCPHLALTLQLSDFQRWGSLQLRIFKLWGFCRCSDGSDGQSIWKAQKIELLNRMDLLNLPVFKSQIRADHSIRWCDHRIEYLQHACEGQSHHALYIYLVGTYWTQPNTVINWHHLRYVFTYMCTYIEIYIYILVGGIPTPLKNMSSSAGMMTFPTEWKVIKFMFQTTTRIT